MNSVFLIAAALLLLLNTLWGLYMRTRVIPTWFADMPRSFARIRTEAPKGWIPLQAFFAMAFIGALISNWDNAMIRLLLLLVLVCYIVIVVSTGVYFVKEILAFKKLPADVKITEALRQRAARWQTLTTWRNILQVFGAGLLVVSCFYL
jgi:hypothetical protein